MRKMAAEDSKDSKNNDNVFYLKRETDYQFNQVRGL